MHIPGGLAGGHFLHGAAEAPDIGLLAIALPTDDLGSHPVGGSPHRVHRIAILQSQKQQITLSLVLARSP